MNRLYLSRSKLNMTIHSICQTCLIALGRRYFAFNQITQMAGSSTASGHISEDISSMRIKYKDKHETFLETDLVSKEPIGQFKFWFDEACNTPEIKEPNAMCLATASKDGTPSARYVLLKSYGKDGFKFYTNYSSRKGQDLAENPKAALTFYWDSLKRSIRIEGPVEKLSSQEADEYFHSRPRDSQIGACASHQSTVIEGRGELLKKVQELNTLYAEKTIPRPSEWGGFLLKPLRVEFWQGQSDRVHDRICFRRLENGAEVNDKTTFLGEEGWVYERLSP